MFHHTIRAVSDPPPSQGHKPTGETLAIDHQCLLLLVRLDYPVED